MRKTELDLQQQHQLFWHFGLTSKLSLESEPRATKPDNKLSGMNSEGHYMMSSLTCFVTDIIFLYLNKRDILSNEGQSTSCKSRWLHQMEEEISNCTNFISEYFLQKLDSLFLCICEKIKI